MRDIPLKTTRKTETISQRAILIEFQKFLRSKFLEFAPLSIAQIKSRDHRAFFWHPDLPGQTHRQTHRHTHRQTDKTKKHTPVESKKCALIDFSLVRSGITPHSNPCPSHPGIAFLLCVWAYYNPPDWAIWVWGFTHFLFRFLVNRK